MRLRIEFALSLSLILFCCFEASNGMAASQPSDSTISTAPSVDPNKAPSEFNHHIAGWALMGVGLLVLASQFSDRLKAFRFVLPVLFVLVGLFLAAWSDGEIWPRGNLNWLWLLHHDAEARQHKVYALLLIAIGVLEYFRIRGSLHPLLRSWAFPALAIVGAGMLLIHDHTSGSGAHSPEARAYLVNPALTVDGRPLNQESVSTTTDMHEAEATDHVMMAMNHSGMDHSAMNDAATPIDHSRMAMDTAANSGSHPVHHHAMSESMLLVEREHFWFMILGLGIALFKFISDGKWFQNRIISSIWPAGMMLLGVALAAYRE
jgi:hypothetical protein